MGPDPTAKVVVVSGPIAMRQKSSERSSTAIGRGNRAIYGSNHFANFIRRDGQGRLKPIRRSLGQSFS